jgi:nucleoside-diphosphate-sugar epimerase
MKVFITGATGQVGTHLVEHLINDHPIPMKSPADILCLVRSPAKADELRRFGVTLIKGTLNDRIVLKNAMQDPDLGIIFHNAANIDTSSTYAEFYRPNVIGTRNMLEAFIQSPAHTFIFASSIAVYDTFLTEAQFTIVDEATRVGDFTGEAYSITKRKCEKMIQDYVTRYPQKRFIITRLGPIIGKKDHLILPNFVKLLSFRLVPKLIAGGRDFFAITNPYDIARAETFLALKNEVPSGEAFNVSGRMLTYRKIYDIICDYYHFPRPKFSVSMVFYRLFKPLLPMGLKMFPRNKFFQQVFTDSALGYIGKSFYYRTRKIEQLGFRFIKTPEQSIKEGLDELSLHDEFRFRQVGPYVITFGKDLLLNTARDFQDAMVLLQILVGKKVTQRRRRLKLLIKFGIAFLIFLGMLFFNIFGLILPGIG